MKIEKEDRIKPAVVEERPKIEMVSQENSEEI